MASAPARAFDAVILADSEHAKTVVLGLTLVERGVRVAGQARRAPRARARCDDRARRPRPLGRRAWRCRAACDPRRRSDRASRRSSSRCWPAPATAASRSVPTARTPARCGPTAMRARRGDRSARRCRPRRRDREPASLRGPSAERFTHGDDRTSSERPRPPSARARRSCCCSILVKATRTARSASTSIARCRGR